MMLPSVGRDVGLADKEKRRHAALLAVALQHQHVMKEGHFPMNYREYM